MTNEETKPASLAKGEAYPDSGTTDRRKDDTRDLGDCWDVLGKSMVVNSEDAVGITPRLSHLTHCRDATVM